MCASASGTGEELVSSRLCPCVPSTLGESSTMPSTGMRREPPQVGSLWSSTPCPPWGPGAVAWALPPQLAPLGPPSSPRGAPLSFPCGALLRWVRPVRPSGLELTGARFYPPWSVPELPPGAGGRGELLVVTPAGTAAHPGP